MKDTELTGGASTDKATGAPVRTATGFVAIDTSHEDESIVFAAWTGPDGAAAPSRYESDENTVLEYVTSINASSVARACALVDEGRDQMVVSHAVNGSARKLAVDVAACPAGGGAGGVEGLVQYSGRGPLLVRCAADVAADAKCHVFHEITRNASIGGARRRSLLGAGTARASTHIVAGASEMRCEAGGECQVINIEAGRRCLLNHASQCNCAQCGCPGCW
jgi:hypothetical protein